MKAPCIKPHLTASSILGLALAFNALAQAPRPPQLESPVVHPDRSVTFSFRAPNAKKVELSAQFLKGNQPLQADTNGIWSIKVGPVEPNLYPYTFVVDGVSVADPANQTFSRTSASRTVSWTSPVTSRRSIPSRTSRMAS